MKRIGGIFFLVLTCGALFAVIGQSARTGELDSHSAWTGPANDAARVSDPATGLNTELNCALRTNEDSASGWIAAPYVCLLALGSIVCITVNGAGRADVPSMPGLNSDGRHFTRLSLFPLDLPGIGFAGDTQNRSLTWAGDLIPGAAANFASTSPGTGYTYHSVRLQPECNSALQASARLRNAGFQEGLWHVCAYSTKNSDDDPMSKTHATP